MGVLGLTPFLLKQCPNLVKQLPNRLRALEGKTIVIDGTLITQRLHFAPVPHRYRHILGWFRLAQELRECGVKALCVFDGKERTEAKSLEAARRKEIQKRTATRGALEKQRLTRLDRVSDLLHNGDALTTAQRKQAALRLRRIEKEVNIPHLPVVLNDFQTEKSLDTDSLSLLETSDATQDWPAHCTDDFENLDVSEIHDALQATDTLSLSDEEADLFIQQDSDSRDCYLAMAKSFKKPAHDKNLEKLAVYTLPSSFPEMDPEIDSSAPIGRLEVVDALASLYYDYRKSVPKITSLPKDQTSSEDQPELISSKHQYQLALEEGKFWNELTASYASPDENLETKVTTETLGESPVPLSRLETIAEKSRLISISYERRLNLPTSQTYAESREILAAMGIPCIETTGPYEAEALASSFVLNGFADYVASEDTDVLVYEAPLLRNITNRGGPLFLLSGADIRAALELSRASFVDFALLLGTDFSARIKNVGPARALRFIRAHHSIESVIAAEGDRYPPRTEVDVYLAQIESARRVFQNPPPVPEDADTLKMQDMDSAAVRQVLAMYGLGRYLEGASQETVGWDYQAALAGNYFGDDPAVHA